MNINKTFLYHFLTLINWLVNDFFFFLQIYFNGHIHKTTANIKKKVKLERNKNKTGKHI